MNAADAVQAAEFACHRALNVPNDDRARVMLLNALTDLMATPLASFPPTVLDLVKRARSSRCTERPHFGEQQPFRSID